MWQSEVIVYFIKICKPRSFLRNMLFRAKYCSNGTKKAKILATSKNIIWQILPINTIFRCAPRTVIKDIKHEYKWTEFASTKFTELLHCFSGFEIFLLSIFLDFLVIHPTLMPLILCQCMWTCREFFNVLRKSVGYLSHQRQNLL